MTITLPLPSRFLSPNGRAHVYTKAKWTKKAREHAYLTTKAALRGRQAPDFRLYTVAFSFATRRRRDDDNLIASCKAYRDGIADALGIDDHRLFLAAPPALLHDPSRPRLEITLHLASTPAFASP